MCGIFCSLGTTHHILPNDEIKRRLVSRGPDCIHTVETLYPRGTAQKHDTSTRDISVTLCSTLLSLRGSLTVTQPYQDSDGKYTLCWNGEAWSVDGRPTSGNDTKVIHRLLVDALKPSSRFEHPPIEPLASAEMVAEVLSQVAGPYAFVFFDDARGRLFFGRDFLGRRSLLRRLTNYGELIISSVSDGNPDDGWTEIEADGVYCIDLHIMDAVAVWPGSKVSSGSYMRQLDRFIAAPAPYNHVGDEQSSNNVLKSVGTLQRIPMSTAAHIR